MRLEGEAVAVCPSIFGLEWSVGSKKLGPGLFSQNLFDEDEEDQQRSQLGAHQCNHHYQHLAYVQHVNPYPQHSDAFTGVDLQRLKQVSASCSLNLAYDECGKVLRPRVSRDSEDSFICAGLLPSPSTSVANSYKFVVGYALTAKKAESFVKPGLVAKARSKGIALTVIDYHRPLSEQGPFDVILHKMKGDFWQQQLKAYKQINPGVLIFDPPEAIEKVYNRQSMLKEVANLDFHHPQGSVSVPKQLVADVENGSIAELVSKEGLKFPLVAKPLWIDGTAKSHALSLAFTEAGLSRLTPPLVLQEFVNHGGAMFKVYVVGHLVKVVRRPSLPDVSEGSTSGNGVMPFPRVSSSAASAVGIDMDSSVCEHPPSEMLASLARKLRSKLGLTLFNLDMIREGGKANRYYVIDINYFPGYGKVPEYEELFTGFLSSLANAKKKCR